MGGGPTSQTATSTGPALEFQYRYARQSEVEVTPRGRRLRLATCSADHTHPRFFAGRLRYPSQVGTLLQALTDVVRAHYISLRPALLDPVVTSSETLLRFEGFSGCCGVYARVDLPGSSLDVEFQGRGTTNVDFNDPLRTALAYLTDNDDTQLAIGHEGLELVTDGHAVAEKKVRLPLRWLKGFSEVQVVQPRLRAVAELGGAEARRFLRGLPLRSPPKRPAFIVSAGRGLRLTSRPTPAAARVQGLHRLQPLERLLHRARRLRLWGDGEAGTTGWELELEAGGFFLLLSPEVARGFSGEGQLLQMLATEDYESALPAVRAQLSWQDLIDPLQVAQRTSQGVAEVRAALEALGARGLVGYDTRAGAFFHRELPFNLADVDALQPRLLAARQLVARGGVGAGVAQSEECGWDVKVAGSRVTHLVRLRQAGDRCSCRWFQRYQGARGPCKHVLAARLVIDREIARDTPTA